MNIELPEGITKKIANQARMAVASVLDENVSVTSAKNRKSKR